MWHRARMTTETLRYAKEQAEKMKQIKDDLHYISGDGVIAEIAVEALYKKPLFVFTNGYRHPIEDFWVYKIDNEGKRMPVSVDVKNTIKTVYDTTEWMVKCQRSYTHTEEEAMADVFLFTHYDPKANYMNIDLVGWMTREEVQQKGKKVRDPRSGNLVYLVQKKDMRDMGYFGVSYLIFDNL